MDKIELSLDEIISKLDMLNGWLKGIGSRTSLIDDESFSEMVADIRTELQLCINNLKRIWMREDD